MVSILEIKLKIMDIFYGNYMTLDSPDAPWNDFLESDEIFCNNCGVETTNEHEVKDGFVCFNCLCDNPEIELIK